MLRGRIALAAHHRQVETLWYQRRPDASNADRPGSVHRLGDEAWIVRLKASKLKPTHHVMLKRAWEVEAFA